MKVFIAEHDDHTIGKTEQHPLVEITLSQMNNRAQVEAVLNGSITRNSYPSRDMYLDTSNGCVTFANDSADLNQKLLP